MVLIEAPAPPVASALDGLLEDAMSTLREA